MYRFIIIYFAVFKFVYTDTDANTVNIDKLLIDYSWKSTNFHFSNEEATHLRFYQPGIASPYDADIHNFNEKTQRIFVTTPRIGAGIIATIGYLSTNQSEIDTQYIEPYPNLYVHTDQGNCDHIVNVYRIKIDECDRLWALDTGFYDGAIQCPPKLLLFDLSTDDLILNYIFDSTILTNYTRLVTPTIDIQNNECDKAFVYIPDLSEENLIVYDHEKRTSYRFKNDLFHHVADFNFPDFAIGASADTFEVTLGPINKNGDRFLYFHWMDSSFYGIIKTSVIKDAITAATKSDIYFNGVEMLPYDRAASGTEVMNKNGILIFRSGYENSIHCWTLEDHEGFKHDVSDTILKGETKLDHATSFKIINTHDNRELLLITSIPNFGFMDGLSEPTRINYQILGGYVDELIAATKCGPL